MENMTLTYPAKIEQHEGSHCISFRDLDGCQTYGDSQEEACAMAQEALDLYLETCLQEGLKITEPSKSQSDEISIAPSMEIAVPVMLKIYREENHKSVTQMASAMEIPYQNYLSLENGKRKNLTVSTIKKAFAALGYIPEITLRIA